MPPHIHRRNSAERAIQTFKNHFIAGLASIDPNFPLSNWCRLLPQAELTLNLLRPSRLNPKLSAYAQLMPCCKRLLINTLRDSCISEFTWQRVFNNF